MVSKVLRGAKRATGRGRTNGRGRGQTYDDVISNTRMRAEKYSEPPESDYVDIDEKFNKFLQNLNNLSEKECNELYNQILEKRRDDENGENTGGNLGLREKLMRKSESEDLSEEKQNLTPVNMNEEESEEENEPYAS